jgi:hypothetical protein
MVIGGQALLIYGEPRFTNDIDITLGVGAERLDSILEIAKEINLLPAVANPEEFVNQTMVLPMKDKISSYRVDFIFSYTQFEKGAISRVNIVNLDGIDVAYASLEDTVIFKLFAGRAKDLDDVQNILLNNENINRELIISTLSELGKAVDIDLLSRFKEIENKI